MAFDAKKKKSCWRRCCETCCGSSQLQNQNEIDLRVKANIEAAAIPYGFVKLFSGARTQRSVLTCPILSVHLYRYTLFQFDRDENDQIVIVNRKYDYQTYHGLQQSNEEAETSVEEEVIMIPVEDVTHITYKCELVKKIGGDARTDIDDQYFVSENCFDRCNDRIGSKRKKKNQVQAFMHNTTVTSDTPSNRTIGYTVEDLPVPQQKEGLFTRCCDAFCFSCRCWCCRKKKLIRRLKLTNKAADGYAQRMITVSIEYSKYSHPDSLSHARLLPAEHQASFFKEHFEPKTVLKFYLYNNEQIDPRNFDVTKRYAETLCRVVMQLKAMRDRYPSQAELQLILRQSQLGTFGEVYNEPTLELASGMILPGTTDPQYQQLNYVRRTPRPYLVRRNAPTFLPSPSPSIYLPSPRSSAYGTPLPPPLPPLPPPQPRPLMLMHRPQ